MTEKQQIEKMAKELSKSENCAERECEKCFLLNYCKARRLATIIYNAGYRKESEVATKIFAELDRLMLDGEIGGKYPAKVINPDKYAELKKKCTEGKQ